MLIAYIHRSDRNRASNFYFVFPQPRENKKPKRIKAMKRSMKYQGVEAEVQGQAVRLVVYGVDNDDAKVSKSPISVNRKIAQSVPLSASGRNSRN